MSGGVQPITKWRTVDVSLRRFLNFRHINILAIGSNRGQPSPTVVNNDRGIQADFDPSTGSLKDPIAGNLHRRPSTINEWSNHWEGSEEQT